MLANVSGYSYVVNDGDTVCMAGQLSGNNAGDTVSEGSLRPKRCRYLSKNVQAVLV